METKDYRKIEELFNKMSESDKIMLNNYLLSHKEEFQTDPVETIRKGLEEMVKQTIERFTNYVNAEIDNSSIPKPIDYTKSIDEQSRVEDIKDIIVDASSKNIIADRDPHNRLLEKLKSDFASMSYTNLFEFVREFYFIQDDNNYQELSEFAQKIAWDNDMHTQYLSNFFDYNYYLENGITPQEFISTAFEVYKNYDSLSNSGKIKN